ncbi:hypothetical protein [Vulcanisaeta souniana]|uniref:hypothetical protein n=1 Tax=Vulcanisaeta souniana TaxID=164452 RepID=UPI001FB1F89D|nr:hypothetical protein [Vulcanisaeta souniana]
MIHHWTSETLKATGNKDEGSKSQTNEPTRRKPTQTKAGRRSGLERLKRLIDKILM